MSYEMTEDDAKAVILGLDCQAFLDSQVGRYVMGTFEERANDAMTAFAFADLNDHRRLVELQVDVRNYVTFAKLIDDAIQTGKARDTTG